MRTHATTRQALPAPLRRAARRSLAAASGIAIISAALAACGSGGGDSASNQSQFTSSAGPSATYQQAKKEGTVAWDGPFSPGQMASVIKAFETQYPGVKIQFRDVKPGADNSQYQLQEATHKVSIDVTTAAGTSTFVSFVNLKLNQTGVNWSALKVAPASVFDQSFVKIFSLATVIIYNKNHTTAAQAPKTWNDLLAPQYKGKIAVDGRGGFLEAFAAAPGLGPSAGVAFAKKLAAQKPAYQANLEQVIPGVVSGQYTLGTATVNQILFALKKGSPIGIAPVSPIVTTSIYAAILKNAPHPAAAKLLVAWLASAKGQQALNAADSTAIAAKTDCPGNGTDQETTLCQNHLTWNSFTTLPQYQADVAYDKKVQQAFGTYTGK
jgi:iron(III) transport system substrate-binding protein